MMWFKWLEEKQAVKPLNVIYFNVVAETRSTETKSQRNQRPPKCGTGETLSRLSAKPPKRQTGEMLKISKLDDNKSEAEYLAPKDTNGLVSKVFIINSRNNVLIDSLEQAIGKINGL